MGQQAEASDPDLRSGRDGCPDAWLQADPGHPRSLEEGSVSRMPVRDPQSRRADAEGGVRLGHRRRRVADPDQRRHLLAGIRAGIPADQAEGAWREWPPGAQSADPLPGRRLGPAPAPRPVDGEFQILIRRTPWRGRRERG